MKQERDIFVISDLHMGDGGQRDNFSFENPDREEQLEKLLRYVEDENGELIVLGDLFEFWQSSVARVLMERKKWLDRFAAMNATYIVGNHDIDLQAFIKDDGSVACEFLGHRFFNNMKKGPVQRTIGGKEFVFMHGHEVDGFNSGELPGWGRIMAIFAGLVEDKFKSPKLWSGEYIEEALEKLGELVLPLWNLLKDKYGKYLKATADICDPKDGLTPVQNPSRIRGLIEKYRTYCANNGYDVAIVGHTHQAGKLENESWYFNSGSWAKDNNEFLTIAPNGNIQFYQWTEGKAQLCEPVIKNVQER
jgi:UDP-2,3-diacylglucosamine pyrophosphatase LpxH